MWRKLGPLAATKFLTNFNDNAFKSLAMFVVLQVEPDPGRQAAFIAFATMVFLLPFVLVPTVAGWLADRFHKRSVMILFKITEVLTLGYGAACLVYLPQWGWGPLLLAILLLGLQSAFFSPAYMGILPELFDEAHLSNANGLLELVAFAGIILGCGFAGWLGTLPQGSWVPGGACLVVAVLGVLAALPIPRPEAATVNRTEPAGWHLVTDYFHDLRYIAPNRPILLCVVGHTLFMSLGALLLSSLVAFGKQDLLLTQVQIAVLQVAVAMGIGVGCAIAGKFSGDKVEFGLVPLGILGMTVFLIHFSLTHTYFWAVVNGSLIGFFGGFFELPLLVYIQEKVAPATRGKTMAMTNATSFAGMFLVSVMLLALTGGVRTDSGPALATAADFWTRVRGNFLTLSIRELYVWAGLVMVLSSAVVFWLLPDSLMRLLVLLLTRLVYSIRVYGRDRFPRRGPVLLLANHVTLVDGLLLSAVSSRTPHFVVAERFLQHWWLRWFARWARLIPVPDGTRPKALEKALHRCQAVLRAGQVLCVFPEGEVTGNGMMGRFKSGYLRMLPAGVDVPVVPVHLGLVWGSIFSRRFGQVRLRRPRRLPYPVAISFGRPLTRDVTPMDARLAIQELASEAESQPQPGEWTFPELFIRQMRARPFAGQLRDGNEPAPCNLALLARAYALAGRLRPRLAADEEYVGLLLPSGTAGVVAAAAVYLCNRVPVFLNYTVPPEALAHAISRCRIRRVYGSRTLAERVGVKLPVELVELAELAGGMSTGARGRAFLAAVLQPSWVARRRLFPRTAAGGVMRPATVLFSSGSTGIPKGAVLTHHNLNANTNAAVRVLGLERHDVLLGTLPFFHSFGFMTGFWLPVMWGCRVVYHANPLDAEKVGELAAAHRATMLFATPTFLQGYTRRCAPEQFRTMRLVITGAEKLPARVAERFRERFGLRPIEGYGTTELSPVVAINLPRDFAQAGQTVGKPGAVGQPIPGVTVKTVDPASGTTLGEGEDGVLLVKGPNVFAGYLDDAERTAAVLQDGWYNTGDVARIDRDGFIFITGRLSRFSKIGGEMVPHLAVEEELHKALGRDDTCAVVTGVSDAGRGERLVVLHLPVGKTPAELVAALRERGLPNLWIPKPVDFHQVERIPQLGSGKLDLAVIQDLARRHAARE